MVDLVAHEFETLANALDRITHAPGQLARLLEDDRRLPIDIDGVFEISTDLGRLGLESQG